MTRSTALLPDLQPSRWNSEQGAPSRIMGPETVSPPLEEAELVNESSSAAENEAEDDEETDEQEGGDPLASLPANATEEELYQALTTQSLNADGTPKRPMNAFMIWGRRRRPQLADQHPMLRTGDISKLMSDEWSSMGKGEKEHYQNMAKRLKDAFNARWPTYVYKRRPNNSRRKRKKGDSQDAETTEVSLAMPGRVVKKRGSISSVGSASGTSPLTSRPSSAVKSTFDIEPTGGRAGSRTPGSATLNSASFSPKASSFGSFSQPSTAYSPFDRPNSNSNSSQSPWSWESNQIKSDTNHTATASSSLPALLRQHSHPSLGSSLASQGSQQSFKHEDDENVVFRSDGSPEPEPMWSNAGVGEPMPFSGLSASFSRSNASHANHDWTSSFNLSFPSTSHGHDSTIPDRSYSPQTLPSLHEFSSHARGSLSSSLTFPSTRLSGSAGARPASDLASTAGLGRGTYSFPSISDSFHHHDTLHSTAPPHMHSNQQGYANHPWPSSSSNFQARSTMQQLHSMSSFSTSSARSITIPSRMTGNAHSVGVPEDTSPPYWGSHPEPAR